ncbi:MAG: hypothetical protein MUQ56_12930, partial [Thermoleophilia bacterium]|nr:hypothetical protein [Thermoleophilia bacterium]
MFLRERDQPVEALTADRADEARRAFLEAIRRYPRFRRAYTNLGYLYISKNQNKEALPMLQKA